MPAHRPLSSALAVLLLTSSAMAAQASTTLLRIETSPLKKSQQIASKQHLEACAPSGSGKSYRWRFTADRTLDFNLHFHATVVSPAGTRKEVVEYPVKLDAVRRHEGSFTTQNTHVHCWMWSNRTGQPIELTFTIEPL